MTTESTPDSGFQRLEFDFDEVHRESVEILRKMEADQMPIPTGVLTLALSLGRVMSPRVMTDDEEVAFLQHAVEWVGMYFIEGQAN